VFVTGSTDGLGKQTAHTLAVQGATVLLHGRSRKRLEAAIQEIRNTTGNARLEGYLADLSELSQVRRLAEKVQAHHARLDLLINNAGIGAGKRDGTRELSQDGYELRFAVNYLAPFLLTHLLLPCLRRAAPARIVNVASGAQSPINFGNVMLERHYDPMRAYSQSKLALVMFTFDLAEALREEQVTVNCLHPASLMNTKMVYEYFGYSLSTVQDGVDAVMYVATSPKLEGVTGKYFEEKQEGQANPQAYDREARRKLRQRSSALTGLQVAHEL
jgi:NAD(P)-dependent dehydrogenase (short-subunit alcohol dehydrogenase family)